jgi:hypothetical protein
MIQRLRFKVAATASMVDFVFSGEPKRRRRRRSSPEFKILIKKGE